MARRPRIHFPGGIYHVMIRGNGGQDIFISDEDRCHFLLLLQEGVERFQHRIHAFCLMDNHLHLAIQVGDIPLSKIMQNLSFRYTRWFNRCQKRVGHLFQGRYKAIMVDRDSYLIELVRYIHLNPVRAGMVNSVEGYQWSGHRAYLGLDCLPWFTVNDVLGEFSHIAREAKRCYADFVQDGITEGQRKDFHLGGKDSRLLGDDLFIANIMRCVQEVSVHAPDLGTIIRCVCKDYGISEKTLSVKGRARLAAEARAVIGCLPIDLSSSTLSMVAKRFGRDIATLSGAVCSMRGRMEKECEFAHRFERLLALVQSANHPK